MLTCNNMEALRGAVMRDLGIGCMPDFLAEGPSVPAISFPCFSIISTRPVSSTCSGHPVGICRRRCAFSSIFLPNACSCQSLASPMAKPTVRWPDIIKPGPANAKSSLSRLIKTQCTSEVSSLDANGYGLRSWRFRQFVVMVDGNKNVGFRVIGADRSPREIVFLTFSPASSRRTPSLKSLTSLTSWPSERPAELMSSRHINSTSRVPSMPRKRSE